MICFPSSRIINLFPMYVITATGSQGLANMIGGIGGAKNSPATVYPVSVDENGALTLEI